MPSQLPSAENVTITGVCLFRVARLASSCAPLGGNGSGYITTGIVDLTATPEIEEGQALAPKNGCGTVMYRKNRQDRIVGYNIQGNLGWHDPEGKFQMFGGSVLYGAAGGDFENQVIGWAAPNYDAAESPGVYLEVITQRVAEGAGDCITAGSDRPTWQGIGFGKVLLTPGEISLQDDVINMAFTGSATGNPNLFDGPWNDWPALGSIPNSPYFEIGYTDAQFDAILATAAAGASDLPAAS